MAAEKNWRKQIDELNNASLFPLGDSWYMGANFPGKVRQQLNYPGGLPRFFEQCK